MTQKAVIDIGSLKMKVAIFDTVKKELLQSNSYLTLMGKNIHETGMIDDESLDKLSAAIEDVSKELKLKKITNLVLIGTEALRRARNVNKVHTIVKQYFPGHSLEVVDQHKEAEAFFQAVSRDFPDQDIMAMDIGGGSVQLINGGYDTKKNSYDVYKKYSLPTGTYKLQQQYSPDNSVISPDFNDAVSHVAEAYAEITNQVPVLVFGSTCMRDFVTASGIRTLRSNHNALHPIQVEKPSLQMLLDELIGLAPDKRNSYYPEGGYFMYGADYLLINLLQAIEHTNPTKIFPTNLNSSYAYL